MCAGWGGSGERYPLRSGYESGSVNGASPVPEPQLLDKSGHHRDPGSSLCLDHHSRPGDSGMDPHWRNAGTYCG